MSYAVTESLALNLLMLLSPVFLPKIGLDGRNSHLLPGSPPLKGLLLQEHKMTSVIIAVLKLRLYLRAGRQGCPMQRRSAYRDPP